MTQEQYISKVRLAINGNTEARAFYFPPDKSERKAMNLRLAREIGFGLKDNKDLGSLYSLLIVSFSLDTTGVCIDAKEFLDEVRKSIPHRPHEA